MTSIISIHNIPPFYTKEYAILKSCCGNKQHVKNLAEEKNTTILFKLLFWIGSWMKISIKRIYRYLDFVYIYIENIWKC